MTIKNLINEMVYLLVFSKPVVAESNRDQVLSSWLVLVYDGKLNNKGWSHYFPLLGADTSDAWLEDFVSKA